ncbi:MAG: OB-fold nucleic acid binding domain-containing protein, partial [Giesbergeria sp.]|nr:OB-fold nucleic acid binding domain-containing protein [Giesbergeria sp.]
VYQEQVMQTAQVLGGYSLGGADMLRRAMGKKKAEEMAEHRAIFRKGAAEKGIGQEKADEVFDLMEKFAGYGFNKSHAAAYSLLAYHTGWLKVHFTAEFFCANMTVEMDDTDKLKVLYEDARKNFKMEFEPPNINRGRYRFEPVTNTVIRYGLGAVKGTGQQAIEAIVAAREGRGEGPRGATCGPFTSLFDFCVRVDRSKINKRTVDALIKAGAFDALDQHRGALSASLDRAFDFSTATLANLNQGGLFDMMGEDAHGSSTQEPDLVDVPPWGVRERLMFEKSALGFYLSGHLFDEAAREVGRFVRTRVGELNEGRETQTVAGIVSDFRVVNGQRGRQGIFQLDDGAGRVEASASEAVITAFRDQLKDDELVIVSGRLQPGRNGFEARFIVQQVMDLATARCRFGKYLRVAVGDKPPEVARLLREFSPRRESTEQGELQHGLRVRLGVRCSAGQEGAAAELQLSEAHRTYPTDASLAAWRAQAAGGDAVVVYE